MPLTITDQITLADWEMTESFVRSSGPGGQNVNKVSSAVHLRFDIVASSLPEAVKTRLLASHDQRITSDGEVVIKAQNHRTREKNRQDAIERLCELVRAAAVVPRKRIPTRPGKAAKKRRLDDKKKRGEIKKLRSGKYDP